MKNNLDGQNLWGREGDQDHNAIFQSLMGYSDTPGWALIYRKVIDTFKKFENLNVIELGCGSAKISLLFSLLGAKTTLVDYSDKQLASAKSAFEHYQLKPRIIKGNILNLPEEVRGHYDVAMSFGTAEHFWNNDRQAVFNIHAEVLSQGGMVIMWVPNTWGLLFHSGRFVRRLLGRSVGHVDETPFTRKELLTRSKKAGISEAQIYGGDRLINDFNYFIINISKIFCGNTQYKLPADVDNAKKILIERMKTNSAKIKFLNNRFSYILVLTGYRS